MNTLDIIIVAAIGLSGLFGLFRGFTSSILSLITWVVALWLPFRFTNEFSAFLPDTVESPSARLIVSAVFLFLGAFVILSIITFLLRKIIGVTGLGFVDRLLGFGLGVVRGIFIVALAAMLATSSSSLPKEVWWNESQLLPPVLKVAELIRSQLPENLSRLFILNRI